MPSRRKIWSKVCLTVVVPAPEEPVTEMMGCRADIASRSPSGPEQAAVPEEGRALAVPCAAGAVVGDALDLLAIAEHERHALVQRLWLEVEDARPAVGRSPAGLLDEERQRVGLVDQPQAAVQVAGPDVARVEEDAAASEDAVGLGDQRGDPAGVEVLAARPVGAGLAAPDVGADPRVPVPGVRAVDRVLTPPSRYADIGPGQHEAAAATVEDEGLHALAQRQHERGM